MPSESPRRPAHDAEHDDQTPAERYQPRGGRRVDEPEIEIWKGTFSPKSMIDVWAICGLVTVAGLIAAAIFLRDGWGWTALLIGLAVLWVVPFLLLAYRRMAIAYRLTSQRFFHERGILKRVTDRIELIRITDIKFEQGLLERLITGTGTIYVTAPTDPSDRELVMPGIENVGDVAGKIDAARRKEKTRYGVQMDGMPFKEQGM